MARREARRTIQRDGANYSGSALPVGDDPSRRPCSLLPAGGPAVRRSVASACYRLRRANISAGYRNVPNELLSLCNVPNVVVQDLLRAASCHQLQEASAGQSDRRATCQEHEALLKPIHSLLPGAAAVPADGLAQLGEGADLGPYVEGALQA